MEEENQVQQVTKEPQEVQQVTIQSKLKRVRGWLSIIVKREKS